jgi:hypothetical protein
MSIIVVNEDHYINKVIHEPGEHDLAVEELGAPYVVLAVRTLVDAADPADVRKANALQDQLQIEAASAKPYTHPDYEQASYKTTDDALLVLSRGIAEGWNYSVRLYQPREEILDGSWTFPEGKPVAAK